jgi:hypothetical protein
MDAKMKPGQREKKITTATAIAPFRQSLLTL